MAKLPGKMTEILLKQGHFELQNSFCYLQIAYWAFYKNFPGTAAYFKYQYKEETDHALNFFNYLERRSSYVIIDPIDRVKNDFNNAVDIFQIYFDREYQNQINLNSVAIEAEKNQDWSTLAFIKTFLDDQLEEVATAEELLAKAKAYSTNPGLYYEFDKELKSRIPNITIGTSKSSSSKSSSNTNV